MSATMTVNSQQAHNLRSPEFSSLRNRGRDTFKESSNHTSSSRIGNNIPRMDQIAGTQKLHYVTGYWTQRPGKVLKNDQFHLVVGSILYREMSV
jgi:hypothetical protein